MNPKRALGLWDPFAFLIILARCLECHPRVIFVRGLKAVLLVSLIAMILPNIRIMAHVCGIGSLYRGTHPRSGMMYHVIRSLIRLAFRSSRRLLVCQNHEDARWFAGMGSEVSVSVVPSSGVDCRQFAPRSDHSSPALGLRVCMVSRLLKSKGVEEFLGAAPMLRAQDPTIRLILIGDPDPDNPDSVDERKVGDAVNQGHVEYHRSVGDVAELLRRCDLLCLPTRYGEGVSRALLEGAACGLPLVASDAPGCRMVCVDGANGVVVPHVDAAALARAIAWICNNRDIRRRFGRVSRTLALRCFAEERVYVKLERRARWLSDVGLRTHAVPTAKTSPPSTR